MTAPAEPPPAVAPTRPQPGVRRTVGDAVRIVWRQPRATLLPLLAIELPVALVVALLTVVLYLTAFEDEPVEAMQDAVAGGAGAPLFLFLATTAAQALFAQVARGAAIISIAAAARGKPVSLTAALDPAFTRMGALLALVLIIGAGVALAFVSIVGLVILPYLAVRVALCFEAMMLEGIGPWAAVRRSWALTRGNTLRLFGVVLLSAAVIALPLMAVSALGAAIGGSHTARVVETGAYIVAQGLFVTPLVAFLTATTTLYYLTIRAAQDERNTAGI